jgi:hypothetical protein
MTYYKLMRKGHKKKSKVWYYSVYKKRGGSRGSPTIINRWENKDTARVYKVRSTLATIKAWNSEQPGWKYWVEEINNISS